jgi:hypothetical protein
LVAQSASSLERSSNFSGVRLGKQPGAFKHGVVEIFLALNVIDLVSESYIHFLAQRDEVRKMVFHHFLVVALEFRVPLWNWVLGEYVLYPQHFKLAPEMVALAKDVVLTIKTDSQLKELWGPVPKWLRAMENLEGRLQQPPEMSFS